MGKNKEAGRSKTRPSSSSLAASLLPTGVSSVGFGGYLGSSRLQGTTSAEEAQPAPAIDGEVALHLKRLGRKDPTTKLKALTALCTIFKQKSEEDIVQIIPQWAFEYKKLLNDYNREVRRATHETMANLVISVRRGLAPHLKSLMGPWWFSQFDDIPEVSLAARRSLEMAFPAQEKRLDALVLYSNEIFLYLDENLKLTPQAMSDKATPADELEDMHQRVLSSSLLAIATLIDILLGLRSHGCNSEDMVTETRGASKTMAAAIASVENMFSVHKYFLEFLKSKNPRVRSATYKVLGSFIKHISEAFNEENMKMISVAILGSLQEKDASCHSAMWDMILLFSRTFPDSWSHANLQKIVLNRFWQFLRNGCYGSHIISYRTLIVFLGSLPTKIVTEEHFIVNFFGNLWSGRNLIYSPSEDRQAFFEAFKECFLWELFTASRYSAKDDMHLFQNSLIETILIELLWHDYISLVNAKEQIGYPSKVIDSNENGVDCASRRPLETYPSTYMHDLGECIIEILSVIFSKDSTLLITFSTAFQKDCLEIFRKEGSSQRFSECIERIVNFFLLLGQHLTEKNQLWPLEYLAGPLVASTFPLIKSLDSPDAVRMLSVVIDIFGPRPIVLNIFPLDKEQDAKKSNEKCKSESNAVHFLRVFRDNFIPWCLTGQSRSVSSRLDLLLALLDDELFYEQWQLILLYATKLEQHSPTENWVFDSECACILAMFVEKVRNKIQNKATIPSSKQNRFQPEHWRHELLDTAAIAVACHSSSTGIAHAPFLRAVIGYSSENDQICFVSKEALAIIFESTLKNFLSVLATSSYNWVRVACSSLMSIGLQDLTQKNELSLIENDEVARFSLEVLDGSFFCLSNLDQNCKLVPCILAAIFIFEWEISMATQGLSDGSSWDQDDVRFSLGKGARALRCKISTNFWRNLSPYNLLILRNVLTEAVRSAISETNTPINDKVPTLCCSWVLDVLDIICCNHGEQQTMLDQLFSEDNDWPIWVAPDFTDGKRSAILISKTTSVNDCRHLQFVAFIEKLISKLGFIRVIAGLDQENYTSYSRSWLAAEILCTWKWNGGNVLESFLPLFSDYAKTVSNFHEENAVSSVVQILVDGAILHGTSSRLRSSNVWTVSEDEVEDIQDPSLRALISSLLTLVVKNKIWRKDEALLLFEYVIDKLAIGTSINRSCLRILPYILNVISHELLKRNSEKGMSFDSSSEDSVHGTIVSWLQTSLSLPPLDFEKSVDKDLEEWIEIIISCYPLSAKGGPFNVEDIGDISHKEKTLILNLFRKQRLGAIATVSSATDGIASTVSVSVQMILANLAAISVGYCWQEFDDDDWDFVLYHLHGWIASSVPMIEEIVEKVDDAVSSKATVEAGKKKLELAVQDVDPSLITISRTALISFSLISQLSNAKQSELAQFSTSEKWNHHKDRILEDVIRLFFAAGAAEAIASSLSEDASSIIASSLFACSSYWELVASCVISSPVHVREKAIQAMELWGLSAGVVSALFGLLFSCKPISSLQFAAYNFLSAEPLCYVSLFKEGIRTMNAYGDQNPSIPSDVESSLDEPIRLRDDISLVIENPCSHLLEMDLVSRHRVNFLLGWALLLSHLQSLPSSSLARERLIQHLQDSANSIILDCIFQHIPLRPGLMQNLKKKDLELPLEVSKAANAAKHAITTCSVSFAVESLWPIGTEQMASFAGSIYGLMIHLLPAYVRNWFTSLRDRSLSSAIESFTKGWCSPPLIADEFSQVKEVLVADDNFSVTVNKSALEIVATYKKEETGMDLVIRLPSCYPLRPVDVDCTRSLGISEVKQRKWLLSLTAFVRNQNGAIAEAIQTWKRNFDKEFQGIEECPICYSIIHTSNHSLPRLACKTCKHKFHSACLFKWFSTSHKSLCPLCQMPFQYNS